jgi:hypothetical protein
MARLIRSATCCWMAKCFLPVSFIHSCIRLFTHSSIHPLFHLPSACSLIHPIMHPFVFILPSIHSLIQSSIHPCIDSFMIHSVVDLLVDELVASSVAWPGMQPWGRRSVSLRWPKPSSCCRRVWPSPNGTSCCRSTTVRALVSQVAKLPRCDSSSKLRSLFGPLRVWFVVLFCSDLSKWSLIPISGNFCQI